MKLGRVSKWWGMGRVARGWQDKEGSKFIGSTSKAIKGSVNNIQTAQTEHCKQCEKSTDCRVNPLVGLLRS